MAMFKRTVLAVLLLIFPGIAAAEVDLRFKGGMPAGADTLKFDFVTVDGDGEKGSNYQLELSVHFLKRHAVGPLFSIGYFSREHEGTVSSYVFGLPDTKIKYKTSGTSIAAGIRVNAIEALHFEGKIEYCLGKGKPELSTPGSIWHDRQKDDYSSTAFIVGGYYSFGQPGLQLGLEAGVQRFEGDFKIWSSDGYWENGKVEGIGPIANIVLGVRF